MHAADRCSPQRRKVVRYVMAAIIKLGSTVASTGKWLVGALIRVVQQVDLGFAFAAFSDLGLGASFGIRRSRLICQNTDIHLTKSENRQSATASHFTEDLMTKISSISQFVEHLLVLWTLR